MSQRSLATFGFISKKKRREDRNNEDDEDTQLSGQDDELPEQPRSAVAAPGPRQQDGSPAPGPRAVRQDDPKRAYELKRSRKFQVQWKEEFKWLDHNEEVGMFCTTCRKFPAIADENGSLFTGSRNFRKQSLQKHHGSRHHRECEEAQKLRDRGITQQPSTIPQHIMRLDATAHQRLVKIFNTAYFVVKEELPFTTYHGILNLQKTNGVDLGSTYFSDQACRRFTDYIYADVQNRELQQGHNARYVSILVDSSTDVSNRDLEIVYLRYVKSGLPINVFLGVDELDTPDAAGHKAAIEKIICDAGFLDWWDSIVGLGADGAATMQGINRGLAARLRTEFPWVVSVHCLAHRLELTAGDTIKEVRKVKEIIDMLESIYKLYKVSPKMWRELREVGDLMETKVLKPQRTQGTRWLAHLRHALQVVMNNYGAIVAHLEDVIEQRRGSVDIQGRAKKIVKTLTDLPTLKFAFFLQDVLEDMSRLSLKLQQDSASLTEAARAVDSTVFNLKRQTSDAGSHLQHFVDEMAEDPSSYRGHQLKRVDRETDEQEFSASRSNVITKLVGHIEKRFESLKVDEVLAATAILETSKWPSTKEELAMYGNSAVDYICRHFRHILQKQGCKLEEVQFEFQEVKLLVAEMPPSERKSAWRTIMGMKNRYENFQHVIELLLVLPLSTAACERGFSCMKRVKTDWRASLSVDMLTKLMFIVLNGPAPPNYNAEAAIETWWKAAARTRRPLFME